ncbi:hypothetical protein [Chitinophaga japonensis]|uniref:Uncharacterized protein n=1 Tax=Chitinophaga japonensis TaxID=104662 RepID=A0A562SMQ3_CHIJA|nr:hypothetical protein [Chitinophaga japonensis]TWI82569.1 hypothetical protein LX66_5143 [Chitinophaga japonensis]
MRIKERLFSNIFLRNILADLGFRSAYSTRKGGFIPYFQYKIGPYGKDYYLYFREEPYIRRYKNEVFNKLFEYDKNDINRYLTFHYDAYQDKKDFLKFLHDEITERLERKLSRFRRSKLQAALDWVAEKNQEQRAQQEQLLRQNIELEARTLLENRQTGPEQTSDQVKNFTENLIPVIEKLIQPYLAGSITVTHPKYLPLLIQHFYLLRNLQFTDRNGKIKGRLFDNFSATDLAFVLRLHFPEFMGKQPNTIQRDIKEAEANIDLNVEKFKRLDKALREFYFE